MVCAFRRSDSGYFRFRRNRISNTSVGEVQAPLLDVFSADIAQEFTCVGISGFLRVIIDAVDAISKLAAVPCAFECGRQDGFDELFIAIDFSRAALCSF